MIVAAAVAREVQWSEHESRHSLAFTEEEQGRSMPSLWGSKKNGNGGEHNESEDNMRDHMARTSQDGEPTERDRLLPDNRRSGSSRRRPHSEGYLDPDDPAVSIAHHTTSTFQRP